MGARLAMAVWACAMLACGACGSTTVPVGSVDCDGKTCAAPASCVDVVGPNASMGRKECWITCSDKQCPADLHCEMLKDGPGLVCEKEDAAR